MNLSLERRIEALESRRQHREAALRFAVLEPNADGAWGAASDVAIIVPPKQSSESVHG